MLGENGTGKTTFIWLLAGILKPDDHFIELPEFNVSVKPQKISPKFPGTVRPSQRCLCPLKPCLFCTPLKSTLMIRYPGTIGP